MLIRCANTLDTRMQRRVVRTKVIAILLLTYPYVLEQGCRHLVARRLDNPSTEATKGEKCLLFWRHASRYIRFSPLSASCKHFYGVFAEWDLVSVFMTRMS